jgi:nucleoid DNA-binding protein
MRMAKVASPKSITKSELYAEIAEAAGVTKVEVKKFFEGLTTVIIKNLGKKGTGVLTLPGLFKLKAVKKPAVKGGKLVPNRFKPGEMTVTKDKPAYTAVKARVLKQLSTVLK